MTANAQAVCDFQSDPERAQAAALQARRIMFASSGFVLALCGGELLLLAGAAVARTCGYEDASFIPLFIFMCVLPVIIVMTLKRRKLAGLLATPKLIPPTANIEAVALSALLVGVAIGILLSSLSRPDLTWGEQIPLFATVGTFFIGGLACLLRQYQKLGMWESLLFAAAYVPVGSFFIFAILFRPYYLPLKELACVALLVWALTFLIGGLSLHRRWTHWVRALPANGGTAHD